VFNKEQHAAAHARAEELRSEFVVAITGRVVKRQKANPDLASGEVEIIASELRILNTAKTPPFVVEDETTTSEETRLHYRYLDLRRTRPRKTLRCATASSSKSARPWMRWAFMKSKRPCSRARRRKGRRDYLVPSACIPASSTRCRNRRRFLSRS